MSATRSAASRVWLFDLDNTLHNASRAAFSGINAGMNDFMQRELGLAHDEADRLRRHYWLRYGATLLGLIRHHGVDAAAFLHHAHRLPELEASLQAHRHDLATLASLRGRKYLFTNAPRAYALRVLKALDIERCFDGVIAIEDMCMFGHCRPKPDARMMRRVLARLRVSASRCVLVEDTLAHQKAARSVGMETVWMQRWARGGALAASSRFAMRPHYVDRRVRRLAHLHKR